MALTLAASMSVYAEEAAPAENLSGNVLEAASPCGVSCNHVTYRNDDYCYARARDKHYADGKICYVTIYYCRYDLICMKCGETVGHVPSEMLQVHSFIHG